MEQLSTIKPVDWRCDGSQVIRVLIRVLIRTVQQDNSWSVSAPAGGPTLHTGTSWQAFVGPHPPFVPLCRKGPPPSPTHPALGSAPPVQQSADPSSVHCLRCLFLTPFPETWGFCFLWSASPAELTLTVNAVTCSWSSWETTNSLSVWVCNAVGKHLLPGNRLAL